MMKNFFKAMWKFKHEESKEKRQTEREEMKEEIRETEDDCPTITSKSLG